MSVEEAIGFRPEGPAVTAAGRPGRAVVPGPRRPADDDDPALAYWRDRLGGAPPVLELVTDRVRPAAPGRAAAGLGVTLPAGAERALSELSLAHGVTPFMTLLAVYALTLGRHAGVRDVCVGTPAGAGPVVLRVRWDDDPTFAALLDQVRETTLGALEHSDAGFDRVVAACGTAPDPSRHPLYQAMLAMGEEEPAPPGVEFALTWDRMPSPAGERHGRVAYDGELFDHATARRLAAHHLALLESALAAPGARVSALDHTTPAERARLAEWGHAGATAHAHSIVDLFLARAGAKPDAVALEFDGRTLTYAQLRARAEHLAGVLAGHGVGAETVVGLALPRSAELVTAMLAVLMAGGAYLPLDPGHPDARLAYMVDDSGARLVLADRDLAAGGVPVLRLAQAAAEPGPSGWTPPAPHPQQRACVLYTSGSTGAPKGAEITHRGIVRLVHDADYLGFGPSDVVAQVANVSFDAATFEIWGALLNSARLVGVPKDEAITPELLGARITAHGITAMLLTTVVFHRCVDELPAALAPLRVLFFGGEAADPRRVAALRAVAPGLRLVNAYGPTECTTIATTSDGVGAVGGAARAAIGRPIAHTTVQVLDEHGREAGLGVPGELHLGGPGLARGYIGRPGLTAQRFVPSRSGTGERLYRTGDIVRWREDGELEYLGRADTQVKIRGVRIEPDEIAGVLTACPGVRAAVVDVHGDGDAKRLVAYTVLDQGADLAPRDLRAHLADRLPEAMVPAFYVTLPELPLTPHGKLDRRALPVPSPADAVQASAHVAPRGPAEELVAQTWCELLGLRDVSAHDDFFALGGHSLLATRAVARIADALGVALGVRDLFAAPTVAGLAARAAVAGDTDRHPPIGPAGDGPHPASFAQRRLWFLDRLAPGGAQYNVPLVLAVDGDLDVPALQDSLQRLVLRQASLRTRLVTADGEPRQVVDAAAGPRLAVEDLRHLSEQALRSQADSRAQQEARQPFDLAAGPLLRVRLLRLAERRFELLLTMHHAVSDGWSVGVLVGDLAALYTAAVTGTPADLPPLPVQYADYSAWQRELLAGGLREEQLGYWRQQLTGAPPLLELPTDRPRPALPRHVGDTFPVQLPPGLSRRLDEVSRAHGVTRFMTLLAAFQLLLGRYADVRDVSVGTPAAGRTRPELAGLIGFFVNTLVLRTRWDDDPSFGELLARVRATTLAAYTHQDVPFDQVVEAVRPPRDPSRSPLFQVMLSMQDVPTRTGALAELAVSVRESVADIAKFDLTVAWDEASLADGELRGHVEYDVDLFDRGTVEALADHYLILLEAALAAPGTRVSNLAMVRAGAAADLGAGPDPGAVEDPATLLELFADAAARRPGQTAVVQDGRSMTYAELAARSDQVSALLRAHGVRPGGTVVVRLERGPLWPVALLGVMKAGAAYVPVDVRAPQERFEHVVGDCGAALVLGSRADAPPRSPAPFVAVEDAEHVTAVPGPPRATHPAAPAYVLYTSGTTGRPKGVCVSHANLAHTLRAVARRYDLGTEDRVLQFAALTFDVAAEELFSALIRGAAVVLLPAGPVPGIGDLVELARRERLSVLNLPASYWHEWVAALDRHPPASCPALRLVVVGSERVDGTRLAQWQAAAPAQVRWLNAYGPTEATITATVHEPGPAAGPAPATVPIGAPLPGVRAYVLDPALRPAPTGVPGDLYLAGPGVALGYLGDPGRTAASFLPDPWGPPGGRMYATGDRVRRNAAGVLEFLGRGDHQIKLRGFRIELGEIESALAACPGVREAAVLLREDTPGRPALVGYVAPAGAATSAGLRERLADRLPGYMVPAVIVGLDQLPHGDHGKIDRRALPAPAGPAATIRTAPTGELERTVAAIWREVLALDEVDANANFFELGGHSLLIVRVQTRLSETLGRAVPVVDLFRFPTVRALARHLAAGAEPAPAAGTAGRRRAETRKLHQGGRAPRRRGTPETLEKTDE